MFNFGAAIPFKWIDFHDKDSKCTYLRMSRINGMANAEQLKKSDVDWIVCFRLRSVCWAIKKLLGG